MVKSSISLGMAVSASGGSGDVVGLYQMASVADNDVEEFEREFVPQESPASNDRDRATSWDRAERGDVALSSSPLAELRADRASPDHRKAPVEPSVAFKEWRSALGGSSLVACERIQDHLATISRLGAPYRLVEVKEPGLAKGGAVESSISPVVQQRRIRQQQQEEEEEEAEEHHQQQQQQQQGWEIYKSAAYVGRRCFETECEI